MGIHCELSGSACRAYEFFFGSNWTQLIKRIRENSGHFSRIDIAIDDFDGIFALKQIEQKVQKGEIVSFFRRGRILKEYSLSQEDNLGQTIYFGSTQSRIRIRMYDKAIEHPNKEQKSREADEITQESKAKVLAKQRKRKQTNPRRTIPSRTTQPKTNLARTEIQSRDERAEQIANHMICELNIGTIAFGILKNYLSFVEPSETDKNKSRWRVSNFWTKFLGEVEKLKLTIAKEKADPQASQRLDCKTSRAIPSLTKPRQNIKNGSRRNMQNNPVCQESPNNPPLFHGLIDINRTNVRFHFRNQFVIMPSNRRGNKK